MFSAKPLHLTAANELLVSDHLDVFRRNGFDFLINPEGEQSFVCNVISLIYVELRRGNSHRWFLTSSFGLQTNLNRVVNDFSLFSFHSTKLLQRKRRDACGWRRCRPAATGPSVRRTSTNCSLFCRTRLCTATKRVKTRFHFFIELFLYFFTDSPVAWFDKGHF